MEHRKALDDLNQQSLQKIEEYVKSRSSQLKEDHHKKINEAKEKWQSSWNDFMEALMYLERLEL